MSIILKENIIFDFDGTLSDFNMARNKAKKLITPFLEEKGIDTDSYWEHYDAVFEPLFARYINKELTVTQYRLMRFTHHGICEEEAKKYNEIYLKTVNKAIIFDDSEPCLKELKRRGHKLYVLTNGPESQRKKIEECTVYGLFEKVYISCEIGYGKPNLKAYEYIIKDLNCKPESCTMIGDNLENDCIAAERAGINAIQIVRGNSSAAQHSVAVNSLYKVLQGN